jgi:hypothetical protein
LLDGSTSSSAHKSVAFGDYLEEEEEEVDDDIYADDDILERETI